MVLKQIVYTVYSSRGVFDRYLLRDLHFYRLPSRSGGRYYIVIILHAAYVLRLYDCDGATTVPRRNHRDYSHLHICVHGVYNSEALYTELTVLFPFRL